MARSFTLRLALSALCLLGAGCFVPPYVPGEVPTEAQLEAMSPAEIEVGMQAMLVRNPAPEFDPEMRRTEAQTMRTHEAEGRAERFASFESSTHDVSGSMRIIERDGRYVLTFSELFKIEAGPDLVIALSTNPKPLTAPEFLNAEMLEVGPLRSISGGQAYELPTDFNLSKYKSLVIYSRPFRILFATASFD